MVEARIITINGMKRSPIVLAEVVNNGGWFSYSITHKPSGFALVQAITDDEAIATKYAKRIWKKLDKQCRHALSQPDFGPHYQEFDTIGCIVTNARDAMNEEVGRRAVEKAHDELQCGK